MEEIVISITKKEVETKLISSLLELLSNEEFILRKKDKKIMRKTKTGYEDFYFSVLNYYPYCAKIETVGFAIRFNAVEEILNPIMVKNDLSASLDLSKIHTTIGDYQEFNIEVFNEKDVDNFISVHVKKIKDDGLAFFSKYKDMADVNMYYKDMILTKCNEDISNTKYNLIMTSLTLMKLCGDKDFGEMKRKYRQLLEARYKQITDLIHEKHWKEDRVFASYDDLIEYLSLMEQ